MSELDLAWLRFALFLRFHIDSPGYLVDELWKFIEHDDIRRAIVERKILSVVYPMIDECDPSDIIRIWIDD